jgi:hypothetical protein
MQEVTLGFKAFDIHELLTHSVAEQAGLYQQQGLHVSLLDTSFPANEPLPEIFFSAACGAALAGWLQGEANKVLLVNTDRPMFWLYLQSPDTALQQLQNQTIASYPAVAPPAQFLNQLLADEQVEVQILQCANDTVRLGLLRNNHVQAALISSAIPPAQMAQYGFTHGIQLGDRFRTATTGLTVSQSLLKRHPDIAQTMVNSHQQALSLIQTDDALLSKVLQDCFSFDTNVIDATITMIRASFTSDGRCSQHILDTAVSAMAKHFNADIPAINLYDFSLLN